MKLPARGAWTTTVDLREDTMSLHKSRLAAWMAAFLLAPLLFACQPRWEDVKDSVWWKDTVFYQIFVRSFADSNGDGIGDFNGLTQKLDYLNDGDPNTTDDLGVQGLWLMPIQPSPSYHGYDVSDYTNVNPDYGSMDDFKAFLSQAHHRGLHVLIDLVVNHTAIDHPWFVASEAGDPAYADWYIWSDTNPGYLGPWGEDVWHPFGDRYFYAVFSADMPDLNYRDPAVTAAIDQVAQFWLTDVGVDGFRIDGAKHLVEEGQSQENTTATHAWFKDFRAFLQGLNPQVLTVGEVWSPSEQAAPYVQDGEMNLVFNFPLAEDIAAGVSFNDATRITSSLTQQSRTYAGASYASFLSNHDMARLMTRLYGDEQKARAAAAVLLTAPGVPFIYYGEEIGMRGDKPDPLIRTPMQWTGEDQGGFTSGVPWEPLTIDYTTRNVAAQSADPDSLLSLYRKLIALRNDHYALRTGAYLPVQTGNQKLLAMLRVADQETVLVLINLGKDAIVQPSLAWDESPLRGRQTGRRLLGSGRVTALAPDAQGRVAGYAPLDELAPYAIEAIQYIP
jgi:alpha-amylase